MTIGWVEEFVRDGKVVDGFEDLNMSSWQWYSLMTFMVVPAYVCMRIMYKSYQS